ncbi:hypothetical protein [uncultured Cohaesibacter sp.]|uniref:hypothetical protein n=1 Tax=uncultured Cohaesibacter sp. TaxID=1002546 RepID=UPI0029C96E8B|nr:hypothetical protein [uncultured Cohaesibacter sp.]
MSSVASLGAAVAYTNAAQGQMALGTTLTKIAHNADNAMVGMLDQLVQQGIENSSGAAPEGMGQALDIKA